ncbi:acyl-CoA ligase (AMP-forming) (exosortase A-associated) [Chitinivorax tropicus]|uniref:Acyl-CoA ligase (AMP-forming) (Exosortase A-associated) n=1 Tax=Chitinivorax tropicus TaxID=714531 RepID=A0A840MGE3_9PROT|nr:acyl-CoA ligase (AMP-forming), exosortase A system-associated [Chitinivorax tropicus]MBB5018314.1 acyl-CoA ligase (AMP-forming) (exosortase A-associated) [Chitinivorax tropicus]
MPTLVHELILATATTSPDQAALAYQNQVLDYATLARQVAQFANGVLAQDLAKSERVAIYLEKRFEAVIGMFGAAAAGGVYVPVNPLLKAEQVGHILQDCNVRVLVTSADRLVTLREVLTHCHDLKTIIVTGLKADTAPLAGVQLLDWQALLDTAGTVPPHQVIDGDMAAILYTSGSTGKPKGVVLSHRNIVAGAASVADYLNITSADRILSVLPLSFDYGMNQLTTAFLTGARVVLMNYLLPRDIVNACARERITGLACVPPLWVQLAQLEWPAEAVQHLRYFTNSGGHMPSATLATLRKSLPNTLPYLMYGLTEAFRSTYLPPSEVDHRPDSMGKAIPNAEIMVLREDGTPCAPNEPGELVHRGVHVSMGYWNDTAKTAERFKPIPAQQPGLVMPEIAVWSGDTVRKDEAGFLYFISRRDEMIKTSGYRVSPTEVEEVLYGTDLVGECAAFGVSHPQLGQAIVVVATPKTGEMLEKEALQMACKKQLPAFMVPHHIESRTGSLPRNPNGKIDRKQLANELASLFDA